VVATFIVITVVMVLQVVIGISLLCHPDLEKYTVPPTVAIMVLIERLAGSQPGLSLAPRSTLPPGAHWAMLNCCRPIGVAGEFSWVTGPATIRASCPGTSLNVCLLVHYVGMLRAISLARRPRRTIASVTLDTDPAKMVAPCSEAWRACWCC